MSLRLEGTSLYVSPDPFGGWMIEIEVAARESAGGPLTRTRRRAHAPQGGS